MAVLTRAHLRVRQPVAGWLAGWCRKKKRRRSGARTTQTTPNHPTQVQSAMHRAVASCRVARRTGALAASARREARARNSGTPRRRMRPGVPKNDDRRPANDTRRPPRRNERFTAVATAIEARRRGVAPHGAPRGVAGGSQPRRLSAASRTTREDFQMAVGFLFLVLHKESETFF